MTAPTVNGRPPRKQLSEQLDRLDGIIESLADGLPEAVRHALKDGMVVAETGPLTSVIQKEESERSDNGSRIGKVVVEVATVLRRSETVASARAAAWRLKSAVLLGTAAGVLAAAVLTAVHPLTAALIGAAAAGVAAAVAGR